MVWYTFIFGIFTKPTCAPDTKFWRRHCCECWLEQPAGHSLEIIVHVNDRACLQVFAFPHVMSRMSVMRVIVLHPYTKFEVRRRPSRSEGGWFSITALSGQMTLNFWHWTGAECQPWTNNHPANFGVYATFRCRVMGKQASKLGYMTLLPSSLTLNVSALSVAIRFLRSLRILLYFVFGPHGYGWLIVRLVGWGLTALSAQIGHIVP